MWRLVVTASATGHERRSRHRAARPTVGFADRQPDRDGGVGDALHEVGDRRTGKSVDQELLELFDRHGGGWGHGTSSVAMARTSRCRLPPLADSCRLLPCRAELTDGRAAC
jgi:hypothetical protein